jgi:diguanylate cyclase (GGDEF)-like protein
MENSIKKTQSSSNLPIILSPFETWMFSLAGFICWIMTANVANNILGIQSLIVWLPGIIFGTLFLLQIKQVGLLYPDISGGMSSYITRLFPTNPLLSKYANWAYYIGWAGVPAIYPFILSRLIEVNLTIFNIQINLLPLQLLLLTLGFVIGIISTKALATMQTFFTIPAFLTTLFFLTSGSLLITTGKIVQISQPDNIFQLPNLATFLIWMFITSYITYTGEATAVFSGESTNPQKTLRSLNITALLKPFIFIFGVLLLGFTVPKELDIIPSQALDIAGKEIFGPISSNIATALVVSSLLLSTTLTVSLAPRVLFQLAKDKLANSLFQYLTQNGTPRFGIFITFLIVLFTFFIGSLDKILIGTGAAFLMSVIIFHLGIVIRHRSIRLKMLGFTVFTLLIEIVTLFGGGLLLDWKSVTAGLFAPFLFIFLDSHLLKLKIIHQIHDRFSLFYKFLTVKLDSISTVVISVIIIMFLSSSVSWVAASKLDSSNRTESINLYISAIILLTFLSVAIIAISIIPQIIKLIKQKKSIEYINNKLAITLGKYEKSIVRLEELAFIDQLTKLQNFNKTSLELDKAILKHKETDQNYCFCVIDIDRFKVVNDSLGYTTGDSLIIAISEILKGFETENITISRIGGDEFGLMFQNYPSKQSVEHIVNLVIDKISSPIQILDRTLFITSCIGMVYSTSNLKNSEQIYQCANIAKHKAKMQGKNKILCYNTALKKEVVDLEKLERELKKAVKQNNFEVYFQPIYDLKKEEIVMVESLLRWFKPDGTSIAPTIFIPLAEETGLINEITWWSLRESFTKSVTFMKSNKRNIKVGVNISPEFLKIHGLSEKILKLATETNFDLKLLVVEITEYMILQNSSELIIQLAQLQKLGIRISLDDFGTGYSNLEYLINLNVDEIKIDKSFTNNLHTPSGKYIAQTMTELSKKLNMKVIYEGVETKEELDIIKKLGGNYIQGFLFSEAIPSNDLILNKLETTFQNRLTNKA